MAQLKQLAKDTVIYGGTTILTRILNWFLVPLYTHQLQSQADYGIVINLYAWTALLLVILTYGMETGFFRFSNMKDKNPDVVYSTSLISIGATSLIFIGFVFLFAKDFAAFLKYSDSVHLIKMLGVIVAVDAFVSIPFARLRFENRPLRFAFVKFVLVGTNIAGNLFFYLLCPVMYESGNYEWIATIYNPEIGVGYVFIVNVFSSCIVLLFLLPQIIKTSMVFDKKILRQMLIYSLPLLIVGIAGIINQSGDKILYPFLIEGEEVARTQLGIYGANYKIAVIMVMFTQGFRFAFEPFVFSHYKDKGDTKVYADIMKYFIFFGLIIFLGVMFYIDFVKYFISSSYHEGLHVVPIVLIANLLFGIFFNLSIWYKLTDKTKYAAVLALVGTGITLIINIIFVPKYGYIASAWANFICYAAMVFISYILMKRHFEIKYEMMRIAEYTGIALLLYFGMKYLSIDKVWLDYSIKAVLLLAFVGWGIKRENLKSLILKNG